MRAFLSLQNSTSESNLTTFVQPLPDLPDWSSTEKYYDDRMPQVTREVFLNCTPVLDLLNKTFNGEKKYKYKVRCNDRDSDEVQMAGALWR